MKQIISTQKIIIQENNIDAPEEDIMFEDDLLDLEEDFDDENEEPLNGSDEDENEQDYRNF